MVGVRDAGCRGSAYGIGFQEWRDVHWILIWGFFPHRCRILSFPAGVLSLLEPLLILIASTVLPVCWGLEKKCGMDNGSAEMNEVRKGVRTTDM